MCPAHCVAFHSILTSRLYESSQSWSAPSPSSRSFNHSHPNSKPASSIVRGDDWTRLTLSSNTSELLFLVPSFLPSSTFERLSTLTFACPTPSFCQPVPNPFRRRRSPPTGTQRRAQTLPTHPSPPIVSPKPNSIHDHLFPSFRCDRQLFSSTNTSTSFPRHATDHRTPLVSLRSLLSRRQSLQYRSLARSSTTQLGIASPLSTIDCELVLARRLRLSSNTIYRVDLIN